MKILFPITIFYPSQIGGPANTLYWHCKALKKNKVLPNIITTDRGINNVELLRDSYIKNDVGEIIYTKNKKLNFKAFMSIIKGINKNEIIHLNSLFSIFSIFSFFYIKLFQPSKKIIWSVRGELNTNALLFGGSKKKLFLFFYKMFNRNISFHSTSTQETIDIKKIFKNNEIVQLPNYIEPSHRLNLKKKNQLLFVGRIHEIKAIHKLIEALHLSKEFQQSSYKLIIAGQPEERHIEYLNMLKKMVENFNLDNKIEFLGHVEGQNKEILYAESQLLILPSETENFGNVVVEALNQSTPVLASKGTPWAILEKYNCGYHVLNDSSSLAFSIDKFIKLDEFKKEELIKNTTKLIDNEYNVDNKIQNWIDVYKNLTNANNKK